MDDLISKAAAIAEVEQWAEHGYDVIHWTGIKVMLEVQPAVDAVPIVHGRWLGRRYDFKEYKYVIVPYDVTTFDNPDDLFCRDGAQMRGIAYRHDGRVLLQEWRTEG